MKKERATQLKDVTFYSNALSIILVNVLERRNDFVEGKYAIEAKKGTAIAVKVTDMLGEEVWVVKQV